jgi:hypothetical protein
LQVNTLAKSLNKKPIGVASESRGCTAGNLNLLKDIHPRHHLFMGVIVINSFIAFATIGKSDKLFAFTIECAEKAIACFKAIFSKIIGNFI